MLIEAQRGAPARWSKDAANGFLAFVFIKVSVLGLSRESVKVKEKEGKAEDSTFTPPLHLKGVCPDEGKSDSLLTCVQSLYQKQLRSFRERDANSNLPVCFLPWPFKVLQLLIKPCLPYTSSSVWAVCCHFQLCLCNFH